MLINDKMPADDRPNSVSGAGIKLEAYESLTKDEREYIEWLAVEVQSILEEEGADKANEHIARQIPNEGAEDYDPNTFKNALFHLLDSKTRAKLKGKK